jgi:hypothetical protein
MALTFASMSFATLILLSPLMRVIAIVTVAPESIHQVELEYSKYMDSSMNVTSS